ncbi:uncharacterized protein [Lepeophtheirus salmonis]|nr:uncharacterized protein LOC121125469 [Lepeophtheirus salmonis]
MNKQLLSLLFCASLLTQQIASTPTSYSYLQSVYSQTNNHNNPISIGKESKENYGSVQGRSDEEFGIQSLVQLGIKLLPIVLNFFTGGAQTSSDRIEDIDLEQEDPLSWQNFISVGIKVLLAIFGSGSDGIDKSDTTPTQAIIGTVISALTGSKDPQEVATMAKQADEVLNLVMTLIEALKTSFSS